MCPVLPTRQHELSLPSGPQEGQSFGGCCSGGLSKNRSPREGSSKRHPGRPGPSGLMGAAPMLRAAALGSQKPPPQSSPFQNQLFQLRSIVRCPAGGDCFQPRGWRGKGEDWEAGRPQSVLPLRPPEVPQGPSWLKYTRKPGPALETLTGAGLIRQPLDRYQVEGGQGWRVLLVGSKQHQSVSRDRGGSSFFPVVSKSVGELKDPPEILSQLGEVPESDWQGVPR